jgi:hypothetical protein
MVPKFRYKEEEKEGWRAGEGPAGGFRRKLNRGPFIPLGKILANQGIVIIGQFPSLSILRIS